MNWAIKALMSPLTEKLFYEFHTLILTHLVLSSNSDYDSIHVN